MTSSWSACTYLKSILIVPCAIKKKKSHPNCLVPQPVPWLLALPLKQLSGAQVRLQCSPGTCLLQTPTTQSCPAQRRHPLLHGLDASWFFLDGSVSHALQNLLCFLVLVCGPFLHPLHSPCHLLQLFMFGMKHLFSLQTLLGLFLQGLCTRPILFFSFIVWGNTDVVLLKQSFKGDFRPWAYGLCSCLME